MLKKNATELEWIYLQYYIICPRKMEIWAFIARMTQLSGYLNFYPALRMIRQVMSKLEMIFHSLNVNRLLSFYVVSLRITRINII